MAIFHCALHLRRGRSPRRYAPRDDGEVCAPRNDTLYVCFSCFVIARREPWQSLSRHCEGFSPWQSLSRHCEGFRPWQSSIVLCVFTEVDPRVATLLGMTGRLALLGMTRYMFVFLVSSLRGVSRGNDSLASVGKTNPLHPKYR